MVTSKSMKQSSTSAYELKEALAAYRVRTPDLELPINPEFLSKPPQMGLMEMHQWCEEMMGIMRHHDNPEQRLAGKNSVEFVL